MTDNDWSDVEEALARIGIKIVDGPTEIRLPDESWCDCGPRDNPVRGIEAGRHLPSCRYGIVLDYLDIRDPRAKERP